MRPTAAGADNVSPYDDMKNASAAAKQAAKSNWPDGPERYGDLFMWHAYNSGVLLSECSDAALHRKTFASLVGHGIVHSDAFSGLGTASITLKQQLDSMQSFLAGLEGQLRTVCASA